MEITKEQFADWKQHPVTIGVMKALDQTRNELKEQLATGAALNKENAEATLANTSILIGNIQGLDQLLNIEFIDEGETTE